MRFFFLLNQRKVWPSGWANFVGPVMLSSWKITASQRNCTTANCLRKAAKKSASKTHWKFRWNLLVSLLIVLNIYRKTETSDVKLSNVERNFVKQQGTKQLSNAGKLEKTLPHQPLSSLFLVLSIQDSSAHRLASLSICARTDPVINHRLIRLFSATTMDKEEGL